MMADTKERRHLYVCNLELLSALMQMTIVVAQKLLDPEAAEAVRNLLPDYVDGDLSALCVWPDQIRHWYKYRWTSSLHFIDTPDQACNFAYSSKTPLSLPTH